jgi:hypothetical protein
MSAVEPPRQKVRPFLAIPSGTALGHHARMPSTMLTSERVGMMRVIVNPADENSRLYSSFVRSRPATSSTISRSGNHPSQKQPSPFMGRPAVHVQQRLKSNPTGIGCTRALFISFVFHQLPFLIVPRIDLFSALSIALKAATWMFVSMPTPHSSSFPSPSILM